MNYKAFLFLILSTLLFGLVAFSQTSVKTYTFDTSLEGWVPVDYSLTNPHITAPLFGYESGQLTMSSPLQLNPRDINYGFWLNTSSDFIASEIPPNSLFRGTFYVSTDQPDHTLVPQVRFALRNETAQLNSILQVNSINNASVQNSPTPTIKAYEHFFQPHRGSLYPQFDGLTITFELLNYFFIAGPDEGKLFLDRVVIDRFDLSTLRWTHTQDFTLGLWKVDLNATAGGNFIIPDFYKIPYGSDCILGIKSTGDNTNTYGVYVGDRDKLSIDGLTPSGKSYLYRGVFNVSTDCQDLFNVPVTTLVMHQSLVRESTGISISANLGPDSSPDDFGKDYFVYLRPLLEEVTSAPPSERYVYCEFDLLNFWTYDPYGGLFLNSARLERTDINNP